MEEKRNHNMLAEAGMNLNDGDTVDDMDVVESLKLNPSVAYTPEINSAAFDAVYDRNVSGHIREGDSRQVARKKANDVRKGQHSAMKRIIAANKKAKLK